MSASVQYHIFTICAFTLGKLLTHFMPWKPNFEIPILLHSYRTDYIFTIRKVLHWFAPICVFSKEKYIGESQNYTKFDLWPFHDLSLYNLISIFVHHLKDTLNLSISRQVMKIYVQYFWRNGKNSVIWHWSILVWPSWTPSWIS
jgi:hypothetical protein